MTPINGRTFAIIGIWFAVLVWTVMLYMAVIRCIQELWR